VIRTAAVTPQSLTHLCIRYILLEPKNPDNYSPILDLELTLYTIVECMPYALPFEQFLPSLKII